MEGRIIEVLLYRNNMYRENLASIIIIWPFEPT